MDLQQLEQVFSAMSRHGVRALTYDEGELHIEVQMGGAAPAVAPPPATVASPAPAAAPVASGVDVRSPMVGTFYRAPKPGAEPYARVGAQVRLGQTLCVVEAMKLLNEIEAEVAGVVTEILVEDGTPVQFGQPLMRVRPS